MKPTWWQLYGLGVLVVALIGVIEATISVGPLRTIPESAVVILSFSLMLAWRRHNRTAIELRGRRSPGRPARAGGRDGGRRI